MGISFCSYPSCSEVVTMKVCTWHDRCVVITCAFYNYIFTWNGITLKPIFHQVLITKENLLVKGAPRYCTHKSRYDQVIKANYGWAILWKENNTYHSHKNVWIVNNKNYNVLVIGWHTINGFVQHCSNSSAVAMELLQSCTKPSIYQHHKQIPISLKWISVENVFGRTVSL